MSPNYVCLSRRRGVWTGVNNVEALAALDWRCTAARNTSLPRHVGAST